MDCMQYGVLSKCITGESLDCPDYTQFMEDVLTPLLMQYEPKGSTQIAWGAHKSKDAIPEHTPGQRHGRTG